MIEFGLSISQVGLLIAVPSICSLVIVVPTGVLADRYGSFLFVIEPAPRRAVSART